MSRKPCSAHPARFATIFTHFLCSKPTCPGDGVEPLDAVREPGGNAPGFSIFRSAMIPLAGQNFHVQPLAAKGQRLPMSGEENVKTVAMDVPAGILRDPLSQTLKKKPGTQRYVARIDGNRPLGSGRVSGGGDSIGLAAAGAAAAITRDKTTQDGGGRMTGGKALVDRPRHNKGWRRGRGRQKGRCHGEQTGRRQQSGPCQPEPPSREERFFYNLSRCSTNVNRRMTHPRDRHS